MTNTYIPFTAQQFVSAGTLMAAEFDSAPSAPQRADFWIQHHPCPAFNLVARMFVRIHAANLDVFSFLRAGLSPRAYTVLQNSRLVHILRVWQQEGLSWEDWVTRIQGYSVATDGDARKLVMALATPEDKETKRRVDADSEEFEHGHGRLVVTPCCEEVYCVGCLVEALRGGRGACPACGENVVVLANDVPGEVAELAELLRD